MGLNHKQSKSRYPSQTPNSLLARIEFEAARNYLKVIKGHSAKLNEPQQLMLKTAEAQIELEQGDRTRAKALLDQIIEQDPLNGRAFLLWSILPWRNRF